MGDNSDKKKKKQKKKQKKKKKTNTGHLFFHEESIYEISKH